MIHPDTGAVTTVPQPVPPHPAPWSELPLRHLEPADRHLLPLFGQGPVRAVPDTRIHHPFERHAAAAPDRPAAEHLGERVTYGELNARADLVAARLVALGVRPGDRVGLFAPRSIAMLTGLLGILKAGAAYVPQDVRTVPAAHLRHVIATAGTRVVLTVTGLTDRVPAPAGLPVLAVDAVVAAGGPTVGVRVPGGDECYVLFTSGTTGAPNGVAVTHRNVCNLLLTEPGGLGIRPGDRVAQLLNVAFDMAAWEILGCLSRGGTLVIRGADPAAAARDADVLVATPTILSRLDPDACRRVRVVAVAGEPCPRALADRWAERAVFFNGCGPTETTIVNTMHRHRPGGPLTIGRPTPNNTVYVLDADGRACGVGEVGEMWAGGDGVSAGYLANPELNAERYAPDPFLGGGRLMFRTRDLGRWTADGELEHLGRTDDQVKVRGFRVELDAVSAVLEAVPGCTRAVTLKRDADALVAFVAPATVDPVAARAAVAAALPYWCVPAAVYPVPELPQTDRGKVDKGVLARVAGDMAALERLAARAAS